MSKTRPEASGPADNARRREERRLYPHPNSLSIDRLCVCLGGSDLERKDRFGAAWGVPLSVRGESIEGAEANANMTENQGPKALDFRPSAAEAAVRKRAAGYMDGPAQRRKPFLEDGMTQIGRRAHSADWSKRRVVKHRRYRAPRGRSLDVHASRRCSRIFRTRAFPRRPRSAWTTRAAKSSACCRAAPPIGRGRRRCWPPKARGRSARCCGATMRAVADFTPPSPPVWRHGPQAIGAGEIVLHGDFGPHNLIWSPVELVGVIDFELARPGVPRKTPGSR